MTEAVAVGRSSNPKIADMRAKPSDSDHNFMDFPGIQLTIAEENITIRAANDETTTGPSQLKCHFPGIMNYSTS